MRISKRTSETKKPESKAVSSATAIKKATTGVPLRSVIKSSTDNNAEACKYIKSAIDVLGASAIQGDQNAKDAIANLSVILFELK